MHGYIHMFCSLFFLFFVSINYIKYSYCIRNSRIIAKNFVSAEYYFCAKNIRIIFLPVLQKSLTMFK